MKLITALFCVLCSVGEASASFRLTRHVNDFGGSNELSLSCTDDKKDCEIARKESDVVVAYGTVGRELASRALSQFFQGEKPPPAPAPKSCKNCQPMFSWKVQDGDRKDEGMVTTSEALKMSAARQRHFDGLLTIEQTLEPFLKPAPRKGDSKASR